MRSGIPCIGIALTTVETISKPPTWPKCSLSCSAAYAGEGGVRVNLNLRREATPRNQIVWRCIWCLALGFKIVCVARE